MTLTEALLLMDERPRDLYARRIGTRGADKGPHLGLWRWADVIPEMRRLGLYGDWWERDDFEVVTKHQLDVERGAIPPSEDP